MLQTKNISFVTSKADEDLLLNEDIKEKLKELLKADSEEEYIQLCKAGLLLSVDIFVKNTKVSINNETYNDLIENVIYSTRNTKINSLRIKDAGISGVISMTLGGV